MLNTGVRKNKFGGYAIKRVLIALLTFFILSVLISFPIYIVSMPEPKFLIMDESKLSPDQAEKLQELKSLFTIDPTFADYYSRTMSGFFTGDWGESMLPASYYSK